MSEIVPNHDSSFHSQLAPFAFQSLNGLQAGQVFALESSKTVLQFDAADGSKHSPPTRCLVIQGPNGVAVRTIQGEMAVNDCIQEDAWLNVNDELSCGNARLRLIRQGDCIPRSAAFVPAQDGPQVICDDLEHDTRCDATNDSNSPGSTNPPPSGFFSPFAFENGPVPSVDGQTMCLSPEELRGLLEPTVYGADEVGYVDSSAVDSPTPDSAETALETGCDPVAETWNPFNSETQPTAVEPEPAATDDFMLLPYDAETNSPCGELYFDQHSPAPTIDNSVWHLLQWGQPSLSHVEIVDFGALVQCQDFFQQVVEWQNQEPCTNPSSCDLKPQTDVHGVIIH